MFDDILSETGNNLSIVSDSTKDSSNSDTESIILKLTPKLMEEESDDDKENRSTVKVTTKNANNTGLATAEKSLIDPTRLSGSKNQRNIENFVSKVRTVPTSQVLADKQKMDEIRMKLEMIKKQETDRMQKKKENRNDRETRKTNTFGGVGKSASRKQSSAMKKEMHKAFLVNGVKYKVPRLPRPKHWVTDRLYRYLWKRMEPKYHSKTRLISEKFVRQLSNITTVIMRGKAYLNYKMELHALMKEMARLGIINTRRDFYHFCHDFFPYELCFKMVPILMPGNERNIPYDSKKLDVPLLGR